MSNDNSIRRRIRAMLALAGDAGATDGEREVAMRKAQELIEKHNIELGEEENFADTITIVKGDVFARGLKLPYHRVIAGAVASLYEGRHIMYRNGELGHSFWGMSHQVEAAEETFLWVIAQIEDLYRVALKAFDGQLTKSQRAELRASFKDAAAARVALRIHQIIAARAAKRDSRALVVVNVAEQKLNEEMKDMKIAKPLALREGFGTGAGYNAGGLVKIQKDVGTTAGDMDAAIDALQKEVAAGADLTIAILQIATRCAVDADELRDRWTKKVEDTRRIA